jgi:hypothetical protein
MTIAGTVAWRRWASHLPGSHFLGSRVAILQAGQSRSGAENRPFLGVHQEEFLLW